MVLHIIEEPKKNASTAPVLRNMGDEAARMVGQQLDALHDGDKGGPLGY